MKLFKWAAERLKPGESCDDIGPGIRPQSLRRYDRHNCIEPHQEYADWLKAKGWRVWQQTALQYMEPAWLYRDACFLLDVIEHMEREEGEEVLKRAKRLYGQILLFTPLGYLKQEPDEDGKDAWGMHGGDWQKHRSGWVPEDFAGWDVMVDPLEHKGHGAIMAVWSR